MSQTIVKSEWCQLMMEFLQNLPHYKLTQYQQSLLSVPRMEERLSSAKKMSHILELLKTPIINDAQQNQVLLEIFNTSKELTSSFHYWHIGYPIALFVAAINFILNQTKPAAFENLPCHKEEIPPEELTPMLSILGNNLMSLLRFMDAKFNFISPYERNCSTIGFLLELLDDTEANTDVELVQYFVEAITHRKENLWMHKIINFNFCNQEASLVVGLDILLKAGADPNAVDQEGNTAADLMSRWNRPIFASGMIRKIGLDMLRDVNKVKTSSTNNNHSFIREPFYSWFTNK